MTTREPAFDRSDPTAWIEWFLWKWKAENPDGDPVEWVKALCNSDPGKVRIAEVLFLGTKAETVALYHSAVGRPGTRETEEPEEIPEGVEVPEVSGAVRAVLSILSRDGVTTSSSAAPASAPSRQKKSGSETGPGPLDF
jgi:hypothetical protein